MANNATLVSGTAFTTAATGFGDCLNLSGDNKGANLPNAALTFSGGSSFSIRCRIKTTDSTHTMAAVGAIGTSETVTNIFIGAINGVITAVVKGINSDAAFGSGSINDGNWHTVTLVVTGSGATIYVDGTSAGTGSGSYSPATISSARIGTWSSSSVSWIGQIDEVAIYNTNISGAGNLNPTAVTSNTDTNLTSLYHCDQGNVSGTTMLDCAGTTLSVSPDNAGNGASLTFTGTLSQWTTVSPAFTITGSGNSIGSLSVTTATAATGTLTVGTAGSFAITDLSSGATFSFTTNDNQTFIISGPTYGLVSAASGNFTITLSEPADGDTTVTLTDNSAGGSFSDSTPTVLDGETEITFTYTPASSGLVTIDGTASGYEDADSVYYRSYSNSRIKLGVSVDYGEQYTDEEASIGFTIYSAVDGSVLLPRTTGETFEIASELGQYVAAPYIEPSWAGVLVWDRPAGAMRVSQAFGQNI